VIVASFLRDRPFINPGTRCCNKIQVVLQETLSLRKTIGLFGKSHSLSLQGTLHTTGRKAKHGRQQAFQSRPKKAPKGSNYFNNLHPETSISALLLLVVKAGGVS
jgi:hypothetical protein